MNKTLNILLALFLADITFASDVEMETDGFCSTKQFKLPSGALIERTGDKLVYQFDEEVDLTRSTIDLKAFVLEGAELKFPMQDPLPGTSPVEEITLNTTMNYKEFRDNLLKLHEEKWVTEIVTDESDPKIEELLNREDDKATTILNPTSSTESLEPAPCLSSSGEAVTIEEDEQGQPIANQETEVEDREETDPTVQEIVLEDNKAAAKSCNPCNAFKYVARFFSWMSVRAKQD